MDSIIKRLQEPKIFDAFVNDYMKTSTYKPLWKEEITEVSYSPSKMYQAALAEYTAAMVGSVIAKNSEKPVHNMPNIGELTGSIGHMGDQWELDADYLDQIDYLEGRLRSSDPNYNESTRQKMYDELMKYAFKPFERAVIAPHKRLDMLYFEGLFKGTQTVNRVNNKRANVAYTFDLGIMKAKARIAAWGEASSVPFDDIDAYCEELAKKGREVTKIRMSKATFRKMCKSEQIAKTFKISLTKSRVDQTVPILSHANVNEYLESVSLPTISIEPNRFVKLPDGSDFNLTANDRVVFQCADQVAIMKMADSIERNHALAGKSYSIHDDNLVGYWEDKQGYHVDYDMWAQPVFNGMNDFGILETDSHQ